MRVSRRAVLFVAALALLAVAALVSRGGSRGPDYAQFRQCPLGDPATNLCLFTQTAAGELIAGRRTVPIDRTITLQGGVHVVENSEKEIVKDELIPPRSGETMSRTPQPVPGGLAEVVDPRLLPPALRARYIELLHRGATRVTATIELAAPPSEVVIDMQNLVEAQGTALRLPVKVRLGNELLGPDCTFGSDAHPIWLPLTTGWTKPPKPYTPIRGRVGKARLQDNYNLTTIRGSSLVDDTFALPGAEGCGTAHSPALDRAVDAALGLPARPGRSTAIMNGTLADANAPAVKASH